MCLSLLKFEELEKTPNWNAPALDKWQNLIYFFLYLKCRLASKQDGMI